MRLPAGAWLPRTCSMRTTFATALVGCLLLAACGGSGATKADSALTGPTGGTSGTPSTQSSQSSSDTDGFSWSRYGPADPNDPPPYQWYGRLERHDCAGLHDN